MNSVATRPWAGQGEVQSAQGPCVCIQNVRRLNGLECCNEIEEVPEE